MARKLINSYLFFAIKFYLSGKYIVPKFATSWSRRDVTRHSFEQNKYAETTTLFIIYSTLSNFKNRKPNFAQNYFLNFVKTKMTEKVCGKHMTENSKWNSLCGYFVSSLYRKTLWLLYVYDRDFCDGITFLGKVHFCIRKHLILRKFSLLDQKSSENQKN